MMLDWIALVKGKHMLIDFWGLVDDEASVIAEAGSDEGDWRLALNWAWPVK